MICLTLSIIVRGDIMELNPTTPPNQLKRGHRRCTQTECGFYRSGHCQSCQKGHNCSARPYEINVSCKACLDCEGKPGYLRFGDEHTEEELMKSQQQYDEEQQPKGIILITQTGSRRKEEPLVR